MFNGATFRFEDQSRAFLQSWAEQRMIQVGLRFFARRDGEFDCGWAAPQAFDLGKNEPHPMADLLAVVQFGQDFFIDGILGSDETVEVVSVDCHIANWS